MGHSRNNAFDFLRMAAALAVLFSHSLPIVGLPEPTPVAGQTFGNLAVALFFSISGYLVCQSWQSDPHAARFAARRILRIFPGLLVMLLLTVFVLGPAVTEAGLAGYFGAAETWRGLLLGALGLGSYPLPGVFEQNPLRGGVNGSLWTIKYELLMYLSLALIGSMSRSLLRACAAVLLICAACWIGLALAGLVPLQLPGLWRLGIEVYGDRIAKLSVYFFAGVALYLLRRRVPLSWRLVGVGMAVLLVVQDPILAMAASWLVLPYSTIVFAFHAPQWFLRMQGYDYSYGVYIYAFPMQQACAGIGLQEGYGWGAITLASLALTLVLAALSWYMVEKPALRLKSRLRTASTGTYVPQ